MATSYKTGPLAGIEYSSERTKRNAREYYLEHRQVLTNAQANVFARGALAKAQQTRDKNKLYFATRWAQTEIGRRGGASTERELQEAIARNLTSTSEFSGVWRRAAANGFEPGRALDRLLSGASMSTGEDKGGLPRTHYMQYVKIVWDDLENIGQRDVEETLELLERRVG